MIVLIETGVVDPRIILSHLAFLFILTNGCVRLSDLMVKHDTDTMYAVNRP